MIKSYFKIAIRNLLRNKVYSFINISGLSLGLACSMLIMLYVADELSYDRFHSDVNHIYRITSQNFDKKEGKLNKGGNSGYLQGPRFAAHVPEIKAFVRIGQQRKDFKNGTDITSREILYADSNFFSVFSFPLIEGNPLTCLKDPRSVVLSDEESRKQFGTIHATGKTILVKEDEAFVPYMVSAVAKKSPQNSSIKFDVLFPLKESAEDAQNSENWFNFFLNTFVVLHPGANPQAVEAKMKKFYDEDTKAAIQSLVAQFGQEAADWKAEYKLQPFLDMHLSKELPAQNGLRDASKPVYSYILSGIAIFILLIASINFINLTVARSLKRTKEIGIRKVVGGQRKQLVAQFLGESLLLCLFAFSLAILIVQLILPVFNDLSNKALSFAYLLTPSLVTGYILLFLFTSFLAGFYPALVLSGYHPVQTLYGRFNLGGKNYLQKSLVVLQFSLASFLIIATFTIYAQFNYLTTEKLGYDDTDLIGVEKHTMSRDQAALFKNSLQKDPNIVDVSFKNGGSWGTVAKVDGDSTIQFAYETIDESYIPLLKIAILKGRNFSKEFTSDSSHSILVNEAFAKKAGWKDPIGKEVNFWYRNEKYTVVGLVQDHHFESLTSEIGPQLFTMKAGNPYGLALIKIKPGSATASLAHIEQVFKKMFPASPYSYSFKSDENYRKYEAEAKWKQIMLYSAILTVFISCIGLFGLSVLSAEKRTKEIGIRKVFGASVGNVVTILSKDFIKLVLIALLVAMPLAWLIANKWLQHYPYRISLSWSMFAAAGILVIFIALATVSFHAVRAAMANPAKSLRVE